MMSESLYSLVNRIKLYHRECIHFLIYSDDVRENVYTFERVQMMSETMYSILNSFR
jgi:hypothetical protein